MRDFSSYSFLPAAIAKGDIVFNVFVSISVCVCAYVKKPKRNYGDMQTNGCEYFVRVLFR